MNTESQAQIFYTPAQVAELLQVQRRTVYVWIRESKLLAVRAGNRVRIRKEALEEFLIERK